MFRRIFYVVILYVITVYYSIRMMRVDPATATPEEYDYWGFKWAETAVKLAKLKVEVDMGNIDPNGHYVFIGNHQSNLDIPVVFNALRNYRVRFVAKKSLFDIPVYGKALAHAGHISIDRENRRAAMKSLNEAVEKAKSGFSPVIFPEGTRNKNPEDLMEFKVGGIIIALKSGLPVVPFVMTNTSKIMGKGQLILNNGPTIRFKALPPIDTSKYSLKDRDKFTEELRELMRKEYKELLKKG
ncbi:lysophospholipid acyltransferase family protein [Pseudodesulfovibrio sp. zrk46]|uniref:lysophospholipid acyltransferase family protein n=1 Tax=Pseudodesulfovibrio sp. zrk46 TaxID=2725288 RepID=UPI001449F90A|nr:lysophospholipid acyltransferase family protein [Pseudodesulfovibrio sp. zrk46]QJB58100.1 1-acyl-sn-glycerol-3-phosphate acyltransferase [Pseudodesulfovibrio sp. zrk46]